VTQETLKLTLQPKIYK